MVLACRQVSFASAVASSVNSKQVCDKEEPVKVMSIDRRLTAVAETSLSFCMPHWHLQNKEDYGHVLGRTVPNKWSHALHQSKDVLYGLAQSARRSSCSASVAAAWSVWTTFPVR